MTAPRQMPASERAPALSPPQSQEGEAVQARLADLASAFEPILALGGASRAEALQAVSLACVHLGIP